MQCSPEHRADRVETTSKPASGIPRRDFVLLPLLSLLTVCFILGASELTARRLFPRSSTTTMDCLVLDDPATGVRGIPNCVTSQKTYEDIRPVTYRLNSRGHRAGKELTPKPAGTFRIVMVGSSIAEGVRVPVEQTFATLLPEELSRETGRKVDLYNEGQIYGVPHRVDLAFQDALDAQPDLVLWIITTYDLQFVTLTDAPWAAPHSRRPPPAEQQRQSQSHGTISHLWSVAMSALDRSRTALMLRHAIYKSQTQYVNSFLMQGDGAAFLRSRLDASARLKLNQFEGYFADVSRRAQHAGVPLVVAVVPQGAQATMISMGTWPAGSDPFKLGREVRSIVERHGETYVDVLQGYRQVVNAQQYFLPVDGHPTARGHLILTRLLANALSGGAVPALASSVNWRTELVKATQLGRR